MVVVLEASSKAPWGHAVDGKGTWPFRVQQLRWGGHHAEDIREKVPVAGGVIQDGTISMFATQVCSCRLLLLLLHTVLLGCHCGLATLIQQVPELPHTSSQLEGCGSLQIGRSVGLPPPLHAGTGTKGRHTIVQTTDGKL